MWVACAVLLDVNASYGPCHPTISSLYRDASYGEQISWSPCLALLYLSSQPASGRAEPSSVCSHAVPHVSENARGPTEASHLSSRRAGDEKKSNKDLRWPLLELLKSSKILFTV